MTLDLIVHTRARRDITEHTAFLDDRDPEAGTRFLAELHHVFDRLVSFPGFGQPYPTKSWPALRRVVLPTFPLSVFYQSTAMTLEVFRVLHHARDVTPLLKDET